MSYELVKIQSKEGYAYEPAGNRHINFEFSESSVIDMSKSYVVLNTSTLVTPNAALRTATGADFVVSPGLGSVRQNGFLDYKTVSLIRNARLKSNEVKDFDQLSRDVNILETNAQIYSKNLGDHQRDTITGAGFSCLDTKTRLITNSVFLNQVNQGTAVSTLGAADLIVPMCDLYSDVGNMMLYPSGMLGSQSMELELENRLGLVDVSPTPGFVYVIDVSGAPAVTPGTVTPGAGGTGVSRTINLPVILRNSNGEQQCNFYVGQPVQIEFTLKEDGAAAVTRTNSAVITAIKYNFDAPLDEDGLSVIAANDVCQITLSKTIGDMITLKAAPVDTVVSKLEFLSVKTFDDTPSFIVNRAEFVYARRRLNPNIVRDYYTQLMKSGMRFSYWSTIAWNINNAVNVNEFFTLSPQALGFFNLTPDLSGVDPSLYSQKRGLRAYRVSVNDMETSNRDILISNNNTSALYKHKVIATLGACNLPLKSVNDNLTQALNGFNGGFSIAYPVDYLPAVDENILLKLNLSGVGIPVGPSFLYVKYNKVINFQ